MRLNECWALAGNPAAYTPVCPEFDSEDLPLPLEVTPLFAASRMFAAAPADVLAALQTRACVCAYVLVYVYVRVGVRVCRRAGARLSRGGWLTEGWRLVQKT